MARLKCATRAIPDRRYEECEACDRGGDTACPGCGEWLCFDCLDEHDCEDREN